MTRPATTTPAIPTGARKFLIHGAPGTGKTPLAASFLRRPTAAISEKAVYVACDRKESTLSGVLPIDRPNLICAEYEGGDPFTKIKDVLEYDWTAEGAHTIILDTGTQMANDFKDAAVNGGAYNAKAVTFGTNTIKLADKPHYGLTHNLVMRIVQLIERCPLNVIALFWSDYQEPEDGYGAWGGPLTVNMTESRKVAGKFPNIIFTRTATEQARTAYYAHTESYGIWVARLAGVLPNPIPTLRMQTDPVSVWEAIDKAQGLV